MRPRLAGRRALVESTLPVTSALVEVLELPLHHLALGLRLVEAVAGDGEIVLAIVDGGARLGLHALQHVARELGLRCGTSGDGDGNGNGNGNGNGGSRDDGSVSAGWRHLRSPMRER